MPFYVYKCTKCLHEEEKLKTKHLSTEEDTEEKCPKCDSSMIRKPTSGSFSVPPWNPVM